MKKQRIYQYYFAYFKSLYYNGKGLEVRYMNNMIERLETIARRYEELNEILMDPSIASDINKMTEASKEQATLETAYHLYQEYKKVLSGIEEAKELLKESDPEIQEMAELELSELEEKKPQIEEKLHLELFQRIQMIIRMLLWKCVVLLVVMKEIFLQVIYIECM